MATDDHGHCPQCGVDFDGGSIYEEMLRQTGDLVKALEWASWYGATKDHGRFGRQIGISDPDLDRVVAWQCPDCGYEWERK